MHRYGLRVKLLVLWLVFAGLLVAVTNAIGFRTALDALAELRRCAGTQFRADVVDALAEVLQQEGKLKS